MTVEKGETVILTGRTGIGKSTLLKLILGLYQPEHGQVHVSGSGCAESSVSESNSHFRIPSSAQQKTRKKRYDINLLLALYITMHSKMGRNTAGM